MGLDVEESHPARHGREERAAGDEATIFGLRAKPELNDAKVHIEGSDPKQSMGSGAGGRIDDVRRA